MSNLLICQNFNLIKNISLSNEINSYILFMILFLIKSKFKLFSNSKNILLIYEDVLLFLSYLGFRLNGMMMNYSQNPDIVLDMDLLKGISFLYKQFFIYILLIYLIQFFIYILVIYLVQFLRIVIACDIENKDRKMMNNYIKTFLKYRYFILLFVFVICETFSIIITMNCMVH
jgi:hypothetical protein